MRYKLNVSYLVFLLLPPQFPSWTWCKISVHLKTIAQLALLKIFIQCLLFPLFIQEEGWERKVCIAKAGALWSDVLLILPISTLQGATTRGCSGCTKESLWLSWCMLGSCCSCISCFYCMFVLVHLLLRKAFALKITIQEEGRQETSGEKVWPRKTGCKSPESINDSVSSDGGDGFRP